MSLPLSMAVRAGSWGSRPGLGARGLLHTPSRSLLSCECGFHKCHDPPPQGTVSARQAPEGRLPGGLQAGTLDRGGRWAGRPTQLLPPGWAVAGEHTNPAGNEEDLVLRFCMHREASTHSEEVSPRPLSARGRRSGFLRSWPQGEVSVSACLGAGSGENGPRSSSAFEDQAGLGHLLVAFLRGPCVCSQEPLRHEQHGSWCVSTCEHM